MLIRRSDAEVPRLVTIVEELKDGFCTLTIKGDFIYLNLAASEMLKIFEGKSEFNFYTDIVKEKKHIDFINNQLLKNDFLKDYEINLF